MLHNTVKTWGALARLLHWVTALTLLFCLVLGFWMTHWLARDLEKIAWIQIHKSWGFVAFSCGVVRIIWRAVSVAPSAPPQMTSLQRHAANVGHILLYMLTLLLPISGWLMASASPVQDLFGIENKVFDFFVLYDPFVPGDQTLTDLLKTMHLAFAWALIGLLIGHVGAALWHHFHDKDETLRRMTYGRFTSRR